MSSEAPKLLAALATAGILGASFAYSPVSHAFDFGNMMNPSKWMGSGSDRHHDYDDGPYRGPRGGPYGGGPWGGPGPYGAGPYGAGPYGAPGAFGAPGAYHGAYHAAPPAPPAAPAATPSAPSAKAPTESGGEIDELKRRIEELESKQKPAPPPRDWGSAPSSQHSSKPAADWRSAPPASSPSNEWGSAPAFRPLDRN